MTEPVFRSMWGNGAEIRVYYYPEPLPDEHASDRIHLLIQQAGGQARGWLMNVADATDIICGLSKAMSLAIEDQVPPSTHEPS